MKVNLLITCVGGSLSWVLLRALRSSEYISYKLIGTDASPQQTPTLSRSKNLLDSFYQVPSGSATGYISQLCEIVKEEHVHFIIPGSDDEVLALREHRSKLSSIGTTVLLSNNETLSVIMNKAKTYEILKTHNINVPNYFVVHTGSAFLQAINSLDYPAKTVVCKPVSGRGNRGVYFLEGRDKPSAQIGTGQREMRVGEEMVTTISQRIVEPYLVMSCLSTPAYDADVFIGSNNCHRAIVRERINPAGIPFAGNKIVLNKELTNYCTSVAKALELSGIHDIDIMTDDSGRPTLLEVNPRPSGSLAVSLFANLPIIDYVVSTELGLPVPQLNLQTEMTVLPSDFILE